MGRKRNTECERKQKYEHILHSIKFIGGGEGGEGAVNYIKSNLPRSEISFNKGGVM